MVEVGEKVEDGGGKGVLSLGQPERDLSTGQVIRVLPLGDKAVIKVALKGGPEPVILFVLGERVEARSEVMDPEDGELTREMTMMPFIGDSDTSSDLTFVPFPDPDHLEVPSNYYVGRVAYRNSQGVFRDLPFDIEATFKRDKGWEVSVLAKEGVEENGKFKVGVQVVPSESVVAVSLKGEKAELVSV